jgi:hypothetical protein
MTWLTLKELSAYSRISERQLRRAVVRDFNRLPSHVVEGRRLVRQEDFDAWATAGAEQRDKKLAAILKRAGLD